MYNKMILILVVTSLSGVAYSQGFSYIVPIPSPDDSSYGVYIVQDEPQHQYQTDKPFECQLGSMQKEKYYTGPYEYFNNKNKDDSVALAIECSFY